MGPETTFFSYARSDSDFVLKLARDLRQAGADVWLDQLDIEPGSRWDLSVETALKNSSKMLVILSPDSVASDNVMDEVNFALVKGKTIVPILFKPCDIPFRLIRLQYADFTKNYDEALKKLLLVLKLGKIITSLHEKDDSGPTRDEEQELEKAENIRRTEEEMLKIQGEDIRKEEERKIKEQTDAIRLEEERKFKEQAELVRIDNKSKNIAEAPIHKKNKYKTPLIVAGIILVLVIVSWILYSGRIDIGNKVITEQLPEYPVITDSESQDWSNALSINSIDGFKLYQRNYPAGSHFNEAQYKIDSIDAANIIEEENAWNSAKSSNTIKSYQNYLSKYPNGAHYKEADGLIMVINEPLEIPPKGAGGQEAPNKTPSKKTAELAIGKEYQGGIIFYIDTSGQHGLIAAEYDQSTGIQWAKDYLSEIGKTEGKIGTGNRNTYIITHKLVTGNSAAKLCADLVLNGYNDWFLPSKDELGQLYLNKSKVGPFYKCSYWSSTENTPKLAWGRDFGTGGQGGLKKESTCRVRAVRAF